MSEAVNLILDEEKEEEEENPGDDSQLEMQLDAEFARDLESNFGDGEERGKLLLPGAFACTVPR